MSDDAPAAASDPYVIYQLRKPSQRGTAVIPRFVPNTHAPAFSPANYRFARVCSAHRDPASLLHIPRSFDYAPSAGSDSSFWSSSSSFVSVSASTLRTAPSHRSLLHSRPVLHHPTHTPAPQSPIAHNPPPAHTSPRAPAFDYPAALAQSISEDALVDTLLYSPSTTSPQYPHLRPVNTPRTLPNFTKKRRSLWQWLFCADRPAPSLAPPSIDAPPTARVPASRSTSRSTSRPRSTPQQNHRRRPYTPSFDIRLGNPPNHPNPFKRSKSWNLLSRPPLAPVHRKQTPQSSKPPLHPTHRALRRVIPNLPRTRPQQKDRPRAFVMRDDPSPPAARLRFQRGRHPNPHTRKSASPPSTRDKPRQKPARPRHQSPSSLPREPWHQEDRPRADRPRTPAHAMEPHSSAPVQKSIVPTLREMKGATAHVNRHRVTSVDSTEPVTSRISSDLSSNSRASTPLKTMPLNPDTTAIDPAAHGMSSDVSSHISGGQEGKSSPASNGAVSARQTPPEPMLPAPQPEPDLLSHTATFSPPAMRYDPITGRLTLQAEQPYGSDLFGVGNSHAENTANGEARGNGLFVGALETNAWQNTAMLPPELLVPTSNVTGKEVGPSPSKTTDLVTRGQEKNRLRSIGVPLSSAMKNSDVDNDADSHSTGLTSLADESVSTHKTISGVEDFRALPSYGTSSRNRHREPKKVAGIFSENCDDASDGCATERPVIFKNSGLFDPTQTTSPGRVSSSASPRRFYSDWSDPHATDIEVYCQCSCNCVYEEECRRTCEDRYGRNSPSVSSSNSHPRRGYPGFQTLPPSMASHLRYDEAVPNVADASQGSRTGGKRTGFENRTKSSYGSPSYPQDTDELADSLYASSVHSGMTLPPGYRSKSGEQYTYGNKPKYEYGQDSKSTTSSNGKRYRSDQATRDSSKNFHSNTQSQISSQSRRRSSPKPQNGGTASNEGKGVPRQHRSRSSSRTTNGSESSIRKQSAEAFRAGRKQNLHGDAVVQRRPRGRDEAKRAHLRKFEEDSANVGSTNIVKRRGMPQPSQSQVPPPYKASGYGREISYDYAEEGSSGHLEHQEWPSGTYESRSSAVPEQSSVVEYETRPVQSPDSHRNRSRKTEGKQESRRPAASSPHHSGRGQHTHHRSKQTPSSAHAKVKSIAKGSTKHVRDSERPSSRTSDRNRAPLFRIF